jgi:ABC-type lipoprotein export system ATPase subunit
LADEPTGALDSDSGHEIVELLSRLHRGGQTIVLVTHDDEVAGAAAHRITMRDGQMVGEPDRQPAGVADEVR